MSRDNPLGRPHRKETHEERINRRLEEAIQGEAAPPPPDAPASSPSGGRSVLNIDPDDVTEDDLMAALNDAVAAKKRRTPPGGPATPEVSATHRSKRERPPAFSPESGAQTPMKPHPADLRVKLAALQARVLKAETENEKLQKRLGQMSAETISYRKRLEERAEQARKLGQRDVLRVLVSTIDSFETALESCQNATDVDNVLQGLNMVLRQIFSDMTPLGLTTYDSAGEAFDPNLHEALRTVTDGGVAPGHVARQIRRGFLLDNKVFRAALVTVQSKE